MNRLPNGENLFDVDQFPEFYRQDSNNQNGKGSLQPACGSPAVALKVCDPESAGKSATDSSKDSRLSAIRRWKPREARPPLAQHAKDFKPFPGGESRIEIVHTGRVDGSPVGGRMHDTLPDIL